MPPRRTEAMTRIYVDAPLAAGQTLTLPEGAMRHLVQVLRLQAGDEFIAFNGHGGEYTATLTQVGKREAAATLGAHKTVERESALRIVLAQCVSKGERMDYTLQKAVELGVSEIVPVVSERTVVRLDAERWQKKIEHWQGVIVGACEQSGRTRIPALHPVRNYAEHLAQDDASALRLTLDPLAERALGALARPAGAVTLLVGPEGGLSAAEIAQAARAGYTGVRLGPRVLRTETAALVCLSNIQSLWGDLC